MTDERRWTIYVCPGCGTVTDYDRSTGCGACEDGPMTVPIVVVPASSVVPVSRLREWIDANREAEPRSLVLRSHNLTLDALGRFLDDVECASNPNNERTT